jgi:carbamoyltransferase
MRGTDIRVGVEAERVTRIKYGRPEWYADPLSPCVDYCLGAAGITLADIRRVVSSDLLPQQTIARWSIDTFPHHLCHAASAAMLLPPGCTACVFVYDGTGSAHPVPSPDGGDLGSLECETLSWFEYRSGELAPIGKTTGVRTLEWLGLLDANTNSVGCLYELISTVIGFGQREVGKTMGLAAWGTPRYLDAFAPYITLGKEMSAAFTCDVLDPAFHALLDDLLAREGNSFQARADLAATVQEILTECLKTAYSVVADREFDIFAIAGGCALNTVANGKLAELLPQGRRIVVPPHAGDSGVAMGSLWLHRAEEGTGAFELTLRGRVPMPSASRPGKLYDRAAVRQAVGAALPNAAENAAVTSPEDLGRLLANGKIIGVFNGASESGPRALGGRSILADPRTAAIKERINREIKHREPFRPLAPTLLADQYDALFHPPAAANPFMLVVANANAECRRVAPAVVHVDGSARVQVIEPDDDPFLAALLEEFRRQTGLAMLLNTSFNRRGEPIVETPSEAIAAFVDMGLDGLWLDGAYLERAAPPVSL